MAASNLRTQLRCSGAQHKMKPRRFQMRILLALVLPALLFGSRANAYTLLTHEELIDLNWQYSIVPLLLGRYPDLTPAQLDEARAYAYGGSVIQDMGYYPFGDKAFSNLTHYVRSGDFVVSLFRNAHDADELAFAVGALSHYVGDSIGHSEATNLAVPVEFPGLRTKYGREVNYAEGEHQHVQTEFAFDIDEIAHHRMAPVRFLRHIGLKVPVKQLALAYYQTYGLPNEFSPRRQRFNVREYRFMVHTFFPRVAYAITLLHRHHEPAEPETPDAAAIDKEVARVAAENDWQKYGRHAGIGTYVLAGFLFILPKFGPLKLIDVKGPTPATEAAYLHSVVESTSTMHWMLARFTPPVTTQTSPARAGDPVSANQSPFRVKLKGGDSTPDPLPFAPADACPRSSALPWRTCSQLVPGRPSPGRSASCLGLAVSGCAHRLLGNGGDGALPRPQMEPLSRRCASSPLFGADDSRAGSVPVGLSLEIAS